VKKISDMKFGLEWEPKLAEIMLRFPWQDDAFSMADPAQVCNKCGRAPGSVNHRTEMSVSLIRSSEMVSGAHDFEPRGLFSEAEIAAAREEWRRRMADLPTKEALDVWHGIHALALSKFTALLVGSCKAKTSDDIEALGCTGCAANGLTIENAQFIRLGLAGSGVGLPCFVPPDRFCLVHGVSGGLQDGQSQQYAERVEDISRPLTPAEAGHNKLVSAARRGRTEHDTHSMLHGHELPKSWQAMDGGEGGAEVETFEQVVEGLRAAGGIEPVRLGAHTWKCDEHTETDWTCRYCLAQAVVEGELTPVVRVAGPMGVGEVMASDVDAKLVELNKMGSVDHVEVFVQAAKFTRRLARD
jgi:hypothetical protein